MIRKRTIATMAALGGMTATVALLAGLPVAKADELADLRANQELLQHRLDQLAQAQLPGNPYGVGGPPGPANVQMMGGSFPRSFLIPGSDTSIRVGGEIRENLSYVFTGGNPQVHCADRRWLRFARHLKNIAKYVAVRPRCDENTTKRTKRA